MYINRKQIFLKVVIIFHYIAYFNQINAAMVIIKETSFKNITNLNFI